MGIAVLGTVVFEVIKRTPSLMPGSSPEGSTGAGGQISPTRAPVNENLVVPDKGSGSVPSNVARPDIQGPGSATGSTDFRGFSMAADGDAFIPNTIIVKQGDTVRIKFRAVGKDYDFTQPDYGFSVSVARGTEQTFQFDATAPGTFTLFCKACGGPAKGPVGSLVVAPKK